jgi:uncharacterized phage-associated protein
LGQTKLNKLFYYLDFIHFRDHGQSVTGDDYICQKFGPVPERIDTMIADMKKSGKLDAIVESGFSAEDQHRTRFIAKADPDMRVFSASEKKLLERICTTFEKWNTNKIVTQTHLEAPWFYAKLYDRVDYAYAKDIDII